MSNPADRIRKALERANHMRVALILNHIDPPERARQDNIALQRAIDSLVRETLDAVAALVEPVSQPEGGGVDTGRIWTSGTLRRVHTAILALRDEVLGKDTK